MTAVVLTAAMVLTAGVWQAPKAEADIYLSEGLNRVSVHDPSIFKDKNTNTYYVFGSHMATGSSKDLMNWTQVSRDYQNLTNIPCTETLTPIWQSLFCGQVKMTVTARADMLSGHRM